MKMQFLLVYNSISFAKKLNNELGDKIIVGEEIMTTGGEIIGLYLNEKIPANLTPIDTVRKIKEQEGIVYIPHPLETLRHGLQIDVIEDLLDYIDIIEIGNGSSVFQSKYSQILVWSNLNNLAGAASSDAHGKHGLGHTYTAIPELPTKSNLVELVKKGTPMIQRPRLRALLYPKYNRASKRFN